VLLENVTGNRERQLSQLLNLTILRTLCELCSNNIYGVQLIGDWFYSAQLHILNQQCREKGDEVGGSSQDQFVCVTDLRSEARII